MKKEGLYERAVVFFLCCVCGLGLVMVPFIRGYSSTVIERNKKEAFSSIGPWINQVAVTLSQDLINEATGSDIEYVDMILNSTNRKILLNQGVREEEIEEERKKIQNDLSDHYREALNLGNLHTLVIENNSGVLIRRPQDNQLLIDNQLSDHYQFWLSAVYDSHGVLTVTSNLNYGNSDFDPMHELKQEVEKSSFLGRYMKEPVIRDVTFVFGIPRQMESEDAISRLMDEAELDSFQLIVRHVNLILYGILVLGSLFLCARRFRNSRLICFLDKIPLEMRLVILVCGIGIMPLMADKGGWILYRLMNENANVWISLYPLLSYEVLFFAEGGCVFFCVYWIFSLFGDGWKKTEESLASRNFWKRTGERIGRGMKMLKQWVADILILDLSSITQTRVVSLMLVNGVILSAILFLLENFYAALAYTVLLYLFAMHGIRKYRRDYNNLLQALRKTAEGDLDTVITEDLGVFEPLKKELDDIRTGFRNAVSEELKSQKMKNELISNVSHDLKTPLTSLISYIDLMKQEKDRQKQREYLDVLQRNCIRLQHLIEDLFEVSKANSGDLKLELVDVDLVSLISQTLFELTPLIEQNDLKMKLFYSHDRIIMPLDPQKTYRIMENLISNAVKYSLKGSRVYLRVIDREKEVVVTLKNISKTEIDYDPNDLVERFVRGDKSRNSEGSGLGLAIAKGFAESQKAHFNIQTDGDFFQVSVIFDREALRQIKKESRTE